MNFSIFLFKNIGTALVVTLKETGHIAECRKIISNIVRIFCEESARYFGNNLVKESDSSFNEALLKVVRKEYSSNISKVPIYIFERFKFDIGERVLSRVDRVTLEANLMFKPHEKIGEI